MNQVILIGRLTKDPEMNVAGSVCKFTLAVDRMKDGADFIRVTSFGKTAELVDKYLAKGRQVAVQGRIQTGSYEKDGQKVFTMDVIADRVEFLGGASNNEAKADAFPQPQDDMPDTFAAAEDDIPF